MPNQGVLMSFVVGMVNVTRQIDKCYDLLLVRRNNYDVYEGKKNKDTTQVCNILMYQTCQVHEHSLYIGIQSLLS